MPRLFSGNLRIDIKYNDKGYYKAKLCPVELHLGTQACEVVTVRPPVVSRVAVDSRKAFRDADRSAVAFARDHVQSQAEWTGRGVHIREARRR